MLAQNITLNTKVFALTSQKPTSSIRAVAGLPVGSGNVLTVSHETGKTGVVSSVFIIDDSVTVPITGQVAKIDNYRIMLKLQYNPTLGRVDGAAALANIRTQLKEILASDAMWTQFLNGEH